jgi:hypothetical protein
MRITKPQIPGVSIDPAITSFVDEPGTTIHVDSVIGSDSNTGTLAKPFLTLAKAIAKVVAIHTADPTQLCAIVVADGSVFAEDLNLENVNLTKLVVTSASGLKTVSAQALQAAADTENLSVLQIIGIDFSAASALGCDVTGASNLLCIVKSYSEIPSKLHNCTFLAGLTLSAVGQIRISGNTVILNYQQTNSRVDVMDRSIIYSLSPVVVTWDADSPIPGTSTYGWLQFHAPAALMGTPTVSQLGASGTSYLLFNTGSLATSGGNCHMTAESGAAKMEWHGQSIGWGSGSTIGANCTITIYGPLDREWGLKDWAWDPAATLIFYPESHIGAITIHPVEGLDIFNGTPEFPVQTLQAAAALAPGGSLYLPGYSRSKMVKRVEAFDCDATSVAQRFDTTSLRVGTGTVTTATSPGKCTLTTTDSLSDSEGLQLRKTFARARRPRLATKVQLASVSDIQVLFGLYKDADEMVMIRYNPTISPNWHLWFGNGTTTSNVDSGVAVTTAETALEIWVNEANLVYWAINNYEMTTQAGMTTSEYYARIQVATLTTAPAVLDIVRYLEHEELK